MQKWGAELFGGGNVEVACITMLLFKLIKHYFGKCRTEIFNCKGMGKGKS